MLHRYGRSYDMCDRRREADIRSGTFPQCTALVASLILCNALNALPFINVAATIWRLGRRLVIVVCRGINRCLLSTDRPSVSLYRAWRSSPIIVVWDPGKARLAVRPRSKQSVRTLIDPSGPLPTNTSD